MTRDCKMVRQSHHLVAGSPGEETRDVVPYFLLFTNELSNWEYHFLN